MQGSTPRTRNTFPLSAARNFDGTVSRFFASSVCSKVPWKAKAHVLAARESVDPRWRSGRSPATPDRLRNVKVPHFPPLCNTEPVQHDTRPDRLLPRTPEIPAEALVPEPFGTGGSSRSGVHGRVHRTDLQARLRPRSPAWASERRSCRSSRRPGGRSRAEAVPGGTVRQPLVVWHAAYEHAAAGGPAPRLEDARHGRADVEAGAGGAHLAPGRPSAQPPASRNMHVTTVVSADERVVHRRSAAVRGLSARPLVPACASASTRARAR